MLIYANSFMQRMTKPSRTIIELSKIPRDKLSNEDQLTMEQ